MLSADLLGNGHDSYMNFISIISPLVKKKKPEQNVITGKEGESVTDLHKHPSIHPFSVLHNREALQSVPALTKERGYMQS